VLTGSSFYSNLITKQISLDNFKGISVLGETPLYLMTSKNSGLTCKKIQNSNKNYFIGTSGKNSITSTAASFVLEKYKNITEVPYKALSQSYVDLEGKEIDLMFIVSTATYNPKVFNLLANTSAKFVEDIPTLQKCLGINQTISSQYLIVTYSTANDEFIKKINRLSLHFMKNSKNIQFFKTQNIDITAQDIDLTNKKIREEYNKWHFLLQRTKF